MISAASLPFNTVIFFNINSINTDDAGTSERLTTRSLSSVLVRLTESIAWAKAMIIFTTVALISESQVVISLLLAMSITVLGNRMEGFKTRRCRKKY